MFSIIKVNVPVDLRLFYGTLKPLQACRIEENYGEGYQSIKSVGHYSTWLRKIISCNRLELLEVLLTFIGVGDVSFHYKSEFLKKLFKVKLSFRVFQLKGFAV